MRRVLLFVRTLIIAALLGVITFMATTAVMAELLR